MCLVSKRRKDMAAWAVKNFKAWPKPHEMPDADPEDIGCELVVLNQHHLPVLRCKLGGGYVDSTAWFYVKRNPKNDPVTTTRGEGEEKRREEMNTQAIDTAKSLQRIQKYLERLELAKGYHKEYIHSFIDKNGHEIPLLVADLKALLQIVATSTNTDAKDAARYRWLRDNDIYADNKLGTVIRLQLNAIWDVSIDEAIATQANREGEKE